MSIRLFSTLFQDDTLNPITENDDQIPTFPPKTKDWAFEAQPFINQALDNST